MASFGSDERTSSPPLLLSSSSSCLFLLLPLYGPLEERRRLPRLGRPVEDDRLSSRSHPSSTIVTAHSRHRIPGANRRSYVKRKGVFFSEQPQCSPPFGMDTNSSQPDTSPGISRVFEEDEEARRNIGGCTPSGTRGRVASAVSARLAKGKEDCSNDFFYASASPPCISLLLWAIFPFKKR